MGCEGENVAGLQLSSGYRWEIAGICVECGRLKVCDASEEELLWLREK